MEWFVINDGATGITDARFLIEDLDPAFVVHDLGADLWHGPLAHTKLLLGGVAPEGVARIVVGISTADGSALSNLSATTLEFSVTVTGRATQFAATRSERLALTPEGDEIWSTVADGNTVVVVDTAEAAGGRGNRKCPVRRAVWRSRRMANTH